jgi:hypothetical protein
MDDFTVSANTATLSVLNALVAGKPFGAPVYSVNISTSPNVFQRTQPRAASASPFVASDENPVRQCGGDSSDGSGRLLRFPKRRRVRRPAKEEAGGLESTGGRR